MLEYILTCETNDSVRICKNKRCFNIVRTVNVMKTGMNEPPEVIR